jgi:hypothetical protein
MMPFSLAKNRTACQRWLMSRRATAKWRYGHDSRDPAKHPQVVTHGEHPGGGGSRSSQPSPATLWASRRSRGARVRVCHSPGSRWCTTTPILGRPRPLTLRGTRTPRRTRGGGGDGLRPFPPRPLLTMRLPPVLHAGLSTAYPSATTAQNEPPYRELFETIQPCALRKGDATRAPSRCTARPRVRPARMGDRACVGSHTRAV